MRGDYALGGVEVVDFDDFDADAGEQVGQHGFGAVCAEHEVVDPEDHFHVFDSAGGPGQHHRDEEADAAHGVFLDVEDFEDEGHLVLEDHETELDRGLDVLLEVRLGLHELVEVHVDEPRHQDVAQVLPVGHAEELRDEVQALVVPEVRVLREVNVQHHFELLSLVLQTLLLAELHRLLEVAVAPVAVHLDDFGHVFEFS